MTEQPTDRFDTRLADLLSAYGDRAVTTYDAAAIAGVAFTRRGRRRLQVALPVGLQWRTLLVVGALTLLAILSALFVGSRQPSPIGDSFASPTALAWSPDGANLAFIVDVADAYPDATTDASKGRPSHPELWIVSADGGAPRHLATLGGVAGDRYWPQVLWEPDGRSIIVGIAPGSSAVTVVDLSGLTTSIPVDPGTGDIGRVSLAPTGDRLLYGTGTGTRRDDYVLDLVDGSTRRVTTVEATYGGCGAWSPDGRWILCDVDDRDGGGYPTSRSATLVVASDGSASHRLGPCCGLGWSSDGRALFSPLDAVNTVYSSAPDGTDVRLVLDSEAPWGWTPSPGGGRWVAATRAGLVVASPGSTPSTLTTDPDDQGPTWSPDGAWIVFDGHRSGVQGLFAVPANGGGPRLLATDDTLASQLGPGVSWRQGMNGSELALVQDRGIVTVDPGGPESRDLVPRSMIAGGPVGSADSGSQAGIVFGPDGPDRDIYRLNGRAGSTFAIQNRTDVPIALFSGLTEKPSDCLPIDPVSPCTVPPQGTIRVSLHAMTAGQVQWAWLGPVDAGAYGGFPVLLDLKVEP